MHAVFADLDPASYRPHALHDPNRMWPETNCYADLWIEVVSTLDLPPEAMFGFTLTQDFEGDQMTFFKIPLEDLEALYGIRCTELAIFDRLEAHVGEQIRRGRLCLVEMDSYYMPDTHAPGYRREHGKTTVGINRLDVKNRVMDYFHNAGFFRVEGEDFEGLFQLQQGEGEAPFLPYTEFARMPEAKLAEADIRGEAKRLLARHYARRPRINPIRAFAEEFPGQVEALADRPFDFFHKYAFNTLRQFGANFELAASHLLWLDKNHFKISADQALRISEVAKSVQFQLARAVTRRKFEPLARALDPAADAWDILMEGIGTRIAS
jgi:hypothetical protein